MTLFEGSLLCHCVSNLRHAEVRDFIWSTCLECVEVLFRAWNFWGQLHIFELNLNTTQSASIYFASRKGQNISHLTSNHWKQQWAIREAVVWAIGLGWTPRSPTADDAIRQPALLNMRPATCMQCCVEKSLALEGVRGGWCAQALITPFAKLPKDFAARINTHIGRKAQGSCARHSRNESLVRADARMHSACVLGTMPNENKTASRFKWQLAPKAAHVK